MMPSLVKTRDRKKHTLLGSANFEEWGSSGFRTKKLKREDGAKQWTGKPREHCERVEPDLEPFRLLRKTMDARAYKAMFKRQLRKDASPGSYSVSNGSGSRVLPLAPDIVTEGGILSHNMQKSVEGRLKPDILKLCQVLRLPEDARVMVGKFLEFVISKHEVTRELETKLEAFQISLCWNAASLVKYKIDKKQSLSLAKQHLLFGCSVEELSDVDSTLRKLKKTFVIDVGNVKELDTSKQCISAIKESTKDQEQPPKSRIKEKEFLRCTKRVDKKLEKRMKKLARKQRTEIDEFHRIWEKHKVQMQEQHSQRASLVSSSHSNSVVKLYELKHLDDELEKKMEEHKNQREIRFKDLKSRHLAKKSKEIGKKGRWLEEMKSSGQAGKSVMKPFENNIVAKMTSSQEKLPNGTQSNAAEVIEGARKVLVGDLHRSGDSENNFAAKSPSSEEQFRSEPPTSVEEVIESVGFVLIPGLDGSGNISQTCSSPNNFATNMPASEVQLPLGDSPSAKEVTKTAANKLLSTCAQMANTEAPAQKDDVQIPTEAGMSDQNVYELVLANHSQQQQQPPSENISVDTNQPTSASPSPSLGSDHGLVLAMTKKKQPNVTADTNQPTSASIVEQTPPSERPFVSINVEPPQESHHPPLPLDTNHFYSVPASVVELAPSRERPIVTLNAGVSRQLENSQLSPNQSNLGSVFSCTTESSRPNHPEPRVPNNNINHLIVDTPVLPGLVNSRAHLETPPSINSFMGDLRPLPMLQGARLATPQMTAQRLTSNPIYNEYERLCRESERVVEVHEYMKLQLNSDCEKELAEIRKKYDLKLHDAEAAFLVKKKELDINSMNVLMNGLYAQSFQDMAEYKATFKSPQEISSNLSQQGHLPHSQAQPIFAPSTFNSTVLSACNRSNSPRIMDMVIPRANFRVNFIQSPPLLQQFRTHPPFSAASFASVSQRAPAQREVPRHPTFQPVHLGMGPRAAARGCYPSLENPNLSRSAFFINLQNQMAGHPSSISTSIPASGSNLDLLSPVTGHNKRGGSGRTNMVNSEEMTGFICLSDDE